MRRRIGKFNVHKQLIDLPEFAIALSRIGFVPYRVEFMMHTNCFEYIGTSHRFEEEPEFVSRPSEYELIIHNENGEITVEIERQNMCNDLPRVSVISRNAAKHKAERMINK